MKQQILCSGQCGICDGSCEHHLNNKIMQQKKVYIAGKVSGLPEAEANANFLEASNKLKKLGFEVVNPIDVIRHEQVERISNNKYPLRDDLPEDRKQIMRICLRALILCDTLYCLPNWTDSPGAWIELDTARAIGIPIKFL